MKSEWPEILDETLMVIKVQAGLSGLPSNKTGFRQLMKNGDAAVVNAIRVGVDYLAHKIAEFIPGAEGFKPSEKRGMFRKEPYLLPSGKAAILEGKRLEVALERAIVASAFNDEYLFNHFALLSGIHNDSNSCKQVAIDLLHRKNENLYLIELKAWGNKSDSPVDALLEISAYYLTYLKMLEFDSTLHGGRFEKAERYHLILMAPLEYFAHWKTDEVELNQLCSAFKSALHRENMEVLVDHTVIEVSEDELIKGVSSMEDNAKSFTKLPGECQRTIINAFRKSLKGL